MDCWYADFQNSGSAEGSLVKSALFLREFATVPWVHLDIAGTAYFRKATAVRAARRDRRRRTPRSSSWRWPGRRRAEPPARAPAPVGRWSPGHRPRGRRRRRSGSPPTGSPPAGRSTTRSTRPVGPSTGGRSPACVVGAVAFGLLPVAVRGRPAGAALFGAWFVDPRRRAGDGPRPAAAARRADPAGHPDRPGLRDQRPEPAGRRRRSSRPSLAAVLIPAVLYLPSIPFGAGAFGLGDVKFLVGIGLMVGGERALGGTLVGLLVAGVVLVALLSRGGSGAGRTCRSGRSSSSARCGRCSSVRDRARSGMGSHRRPDHRGHRTSAPVDG